MSGSYDRPPGPPPPVPPQRLRPRLDSFTAPHTSPPSHPAHPPGVPAHAAPVAEVGHREPDAYSEDTTGYSQPLSEPVSHQSAPTDLDLRADERSPATAASVRKGQSAPVVPPDSVTGKSLTLVVSIMCFLACLTAGAVYMVNQSASAWLRDIASEVTVQIEPREKVDTERLVKDVSAFLAQQPGIRTVKPMGLDESAALIEPWLGTSDVLKSLPLPRLIAIDVDRAEPPDFPALRQKLGQQFKGVSLDDHRQWQSQIRTVTRSLALGGLGILMLVGAATTAIIISATRSSMSANREIVEVLHFVGASDRFIAREFERHFLRLGVRAGVVGASFAMVVFFFMPMGMELLGGGSATMAELRRLVGVGTLDLAGYLVLVVVVVIIAALCMLTSRVSVYRILNSQH